jgi:ABC-type uncharacterized transport system involved in gliding motility auxiliary subunit
VAANYGSHPITNGFNVLTAFPLARSVSPTGSATNGRVATTIIETSPRSWAETNIAQLRAKGEVALNPDQGDKQGPVSIGAAVSGPATDTAGEAVPKASNGQQDEEAQKPEARMAVIGDSDFVATFALGIQGNRDLFINTVNWLAQQENLISIRAREPADRRLTMTAQQTVGVFWMSIVLVPALVLGTGIFAWWRRR